MSNTIVGLFFGIGLAGFIYAKMMHQTGGNTKNSVIAAIGVGVVGFIIIYTLFGTFFSGN